MQESQVSFRVHAYFRVYVWHVRMGVGVNYEYTTLVGPSFPIHLQLEPDTDSPLLPLLNSVIGL